MTTKAELSSRLPCGYMLRGWDRRFASIVVFFKKGTMRSSPKPSAGKFVSGKSVSGKSVSRKSFGGQLFRLRKQLLAAAILIPVAVPAPAADAPGLFDARPILRQTHPDMAAFAREARPVIAQANAALLAAERQRRGVSCARQTLVELRWRINATGDLAAARANLTRLKAALADVEATKTLAGSALAGPGRDANILPQDADGSYGACDREWFLKLDDSGDQLLDPSGWHGKIPPRFLERVNTPAALVAYLERIIVSDLGKDGVDHRKELNAATGVLARVVLRGGVAGYLTAPEFRTAFRSFLDLWQDPATGFFGEWYIDHGRVAKTADLSVTFHMARYTKGRIGHWQKLIDTLLAIKDRPYPQGWLDDDGMTNHNNYDVAELFRLGWPHMSDDQRGAARAEIARMLDWALTHSINPDGEIAATGAAEPLGDMYYFATSFLDTIGYFDKRKRFWTDEDFPQAEKLRAALEAKARLIASDAPFAEATLARLALHPVGEDRTPAAWAKAATSLLPASALPMSGWMEARPLTAHDDIARRSRTLDPSHIEESTP
ncbi:hypothetical protein SAMN05519103_06833 [Rhizobiales bacterium GAS113]|nr:hypothetical protein SAMN05519103_06833 [Rhizobiales bacterium GAS113]